MSDRLLGNPGAKLKDVMLKFNSEELVLEAPPVQGVVTHTVSVVSTLLVIVATVVVTTAEDDDVESLVVLAADAVEHGFVT